MNIPEKNPYSNKQIAFFIVFIVVLVVFALIKYPKKAQPNYLPTPDEKYIGIEPAEEIIVKFDTAAFIIEEKEKFRKSREYNIKYLYGDNYQGNHRGLDAYLKNYKTCWMLIRKHQDSEYPELKTLAIELKKLTIAHQKEHLTLWRKLYVKNVDKILRAENMSASLVSGNILKILVRVNSEIGQDYMIETLRPVCIDARFKKIRFQNKYTNKVYTYDLDTPDDGHPF